MNDKNFAQIIHLSAFSGLIIPFGNIIVPLILWLFKRDQSFFINQHGKDVLNFQTSISIYYIIASIISVPFFVITFGLGYFLSLIMLGVSLLIVAILVINASKKANNGYYYKYPFSLSIFK
ncbi:DUF4870 domain-containing protein [Aureivirga sp. CE67]|uniref:DUF4870 domain-containing protein n=1 Tax=Aureivirga sp. CE67 TaxID=1788983 RepID=UPI0018C9F51B|nr:DUF4870 domain-containing protein [Aureivirga sp. CE67]